MNSRVYHANYNVDKVKRTREDIFQLRTLEFTLDLLSVDNKLKKKSLVFGFCNLRVAKTITILKLQFI